VIKSLAHFDLSPPSSAADAGDVMKWMVSVMDRDDKSLHFVASVLSHFLKTGGLSEKQAEALEKRYAIVLDQFEKGVLNIQTGKASTARVSASITHIGLTRSTHPEGAAQ